MISFDRVRQPVKESDRRPGPFPYYGASGIVDNVDQYLFDGDYLLVAEDGENLRTRQTPIAFIATGKFWVNNHAHVLQGNSKGDTRYLMYALRVADVSAFLTGSTMPKLTAGNLARIPIPFRSLAEQRAIASILGALDDKIELNRKMSATLEAIARALFKSWFVDFDPVRAKAEGRDPGLPAQIAALFADSFSHCSQGEIPAGWHVGTVEELCRSVSSGGTPTRLRREYWDNGTIPWFKTGELQDRPLLNSSEHITDAAVKHSSCKLWPANTILFALYASPTVGRMGLLTKEGTSNQAAAGLLADDRYGTPFLFQTLFLARQDLQHIAVGAAQQNINLGVLKAHKVIVPPYRLAGRYSEHMRPLVDRQIEIIQQSATLTALRDTLLPKLISGELRVDDDAERILAATA